MARREPTKLGGCLKYNIGSFLAVFVLGWVALQQHISCDSVNLAPSKPKPLRALGHQDESEDEEKETEEIEAEKSEIKDEAQEDSRESPAASPAGKAKKWVFCAAQWQDCTCQGNVRWGNKEKWLIIKPKKAGELQTVQLGFVSN